MVNPWNEGKPIKIGRDGQEIEPSITYMFVLCFQPSLKAHTNVANFKAKLS